MRQIRGFYKKSLIALSFVALVLTGCTNAQLYPLPPSYPVITLQVLNYCPTVVGSAPNADYYNFKDIFFYNSNSYFNGTGYVFDTDGDGLPDFFEQNLANIALWGISYFYADTSQNGYSDLVKVRLGIVASADASMPICYKTGDSDGDGLVDCEEQLIGTQPGLSDTDGDGIPDGIEWRFGMNPLDPNDAYLNPTGDGFSNYQKAKWGVTIDTTVTPQGKGQLPVYQAPVATSKPAPGLTCTNPQTFTISNISIVPVVGGYNVLYLKTIEDPQNPVSNGGQTLGRVTQYTSLAIPTSIANNSTVIVSTGMKPVATFTVVSP